MRLVFPRQGPHKGPGKVGLIMKALLASVCALVLVGSASANITINGTGKVTYVPDIAHVNIGASSDGKTAAEAWQKNADLVKKVFDALKKLNIAPRDIKTTGLNVSPRYHHSKDQPPRLLGYTATYNLTVTVRDLAKLAAVLDRSVDAGANRDVGISFGCADPEKLLDQARAKAVRDARKKAEVLVAGAGATLGQVIAISEGQSAPWRTFRYEQKMDAMPSALPIAP